jgi:hypothetical protein
MVQSRGGARLPLESPQRPVGISRTGILRRFKKLDCNLTAELKVFGTIDNTHAALPDFGDDAEMRD